MIDKNMSKIHPLSNRRTSFVDTKLRTDKESTSREIGYSTKSEPGSCYSDEDENIRDNIQKLFHKHNYKSEFLFDDRSDAMNLINLRQNLDNKSGIYEFFGKSLIKSDSFKPEVLTPGNKLPSGIILPESKFLSYWTIMVLIALTYTITFMPY